MDFGSLKEDERFEAKRCTDGLSKDFWETYSAFANTFGGTVALGVGEDPDDRRRLVPLGVRDPDKTIKELWDLLNDPRKTNVNLLTEDDIEVVDADGAKVILVRVPRAERERRPVFVNGSLNNGTYRRNGEGDYHCSMSEISEMLRDARGDSMDGSLCTKVLLRDLDSKSVESYRNMLAARRPEHPWNKEPTDEFLRLIGAADFDSDGELRPTIAGALMFGFDYSISRELPGYMLDYLEFNRSSDDWVHRLTTDTGEWSGNLLDFYMHVANRLNWNGDRPFRLDGAVRTDDSDLLKAEREAVLNAVVHADYNGSDGVRVELRPDMLVVRNPGTFRIPVRLAESGGHSDPRNRGIMKMFMLIGLVERAGSGIRRMVQACRDMGLEQPSFEESMNPATVTLTLRMGGAVRPDPENRGSKRASIRSDILEFVLANSRATIPEIAEATGRSTSTVSRILGELKEAGLLEREGSKARGRWVPGPNMSRVAGTGSPSDVEQDRDRRGVPVDLHHVVRHGLDLRPHTVLRAVQPLAPRGADHVVPLEADVELPQDEVVGVLNEQHLGEEREQPVLVVDAGYADIDGLGRPDVGEVHGLVEQRVGGVAEAFLESGAEGADHHVGRVVDEDVSLHAAGIGHGR